MTETARMYGGSLYDLAAEEGLDERILGELDGVTALLNGDAEYLHLLSIPSIPKKERCALLDEAFRGQVHLYVLNFMKLLCEKGALRELPGSRWCRVSAAGSIDQYASFPSSHGLPLCGASVRVSGLGALRYRQYNSTAHTAAVRNAKKQRRHRMRHHLSVHTLCVDRAEYFPCTLTENSGKEYTKEDILRG